MQRIEITRAEFEERYGFKPDPSSLGVIFAGGIAGGKEMPPVMEYVFSDEALPCESPLEVKELERLYRLEDPRA